MILHIEENKTTQNRVIVTDGESSFNTGQNEREGTTQNTTVTKSAACASYIKATTIRKKIYYWSKRKRRNYSRYNRYQKCCVRKL
jgi:hypothetical protein